MRNNLSSCLVVLFVIGVVVVMMVGGLVLSGVIKVGNTIIDREVTVNSQQYITSVNTALLNYKSDYESTTDPNRRASVVDQFCHEAAKIHVDQIDAQALPFYQIHCP